MSVNFHNSEFAAAYGTSKQIPGGVLPEIAVCGRSNVGKSSLLNKLMYRKNLAKVSSKPGKTATVCDVDKVPADEMILDVGPKTVELYAGLLQKAATVVWNGPVGAFETDPFGAGTKALAEALAASPAFVVVGGGDSVAAVESYGLADKMGYISTGGGASLELLEGKLLPSVAALQDRGE